jgi:hypothetical protein
MAALQSIGDSRAAPLFRKLAHVPCNQMAYSAKTSLVRGLSRLGHATDIALLTRWARACPDVRETALEAVGVLGGVEPMVRLIREIEVAPMKPEQMRDYELLEARVRERIARRAYPGD